jgi:predicted dehydrogenase
MGRVHASKYVLMPDVEVQVWEQDEERRAAFCSAFKATPAESMDGMLLAVDAVDICLPTDLHCAVGLAALATGKPTLIEKPLARTEEECRQLIDAAKASGAMLVPAHVVRFFREFRNAHDVIALGKIGTPASVRLRRGGKAPLGSQGWFRDHARSGGVILDLAIHELDWLLWTLGPVKQVFARSVGTGPQVEGAEFVGDYALIVMTHESGCVSHVEATWLDPSGFRVTLEASGSNGMMEFDSRKNPMVTAYLPDQPAIFELNRPPDEDPYFLQLSAFVKAAKGEGEPAVRAEEGMAAVRVAEAALKSAQTCEPVWL